MHVTDVTNASRTQLLKLLTLDGMKVARAFDMPRAVLQKCVRAAKSMEKRTKCVASVPITGILGDQQAALVARRVFGPGEVRTPTARAAFFNEHGRTACLQTSAAHHGRLQVCAGGTLRLK